MAHAFNPSTQEAEAGGAQSSRPAWSTERVPQQPGLQEKLWVWESDTTHMSFSGVVTHTYNPSTQEAEAGEFV